MRGRHVKGVWTYDGSVYAPARYRKRCGYDAFLPDPVAGFNEALPADLAGVVSDAEAAVRALNDGARPALAPLARLLLRTESIASSKVEGLQVDARSLARAEAHAETGKTLGPTVEEVLANIDAMELALEAVSELQDTWRAQVRRQLRLAHPRPGVRLRSGRLPGRTPSASGLAARVGSTPSWKGGSS